MRLILSVFSFALSASLIISACGGTTETTGSGGAGGAGGSAGTGAASCSGYDDLTGGVPVTITARNDSGADAWLIRTLCGGPSYFSLSDAANAGVPQPVANCSCEVQQESAQTCFFSCGGPTFEVVYIPPGNSYEMTWSGNTVTTRDMPDGCYADTANTFDSCVQVEPAAAGPYTATVEVYRGLTTCSGGSDDCKCTPQGSGGCTVQTFDHDGTAPIAAQATFNAPGDTGVTISIN